jgi:hypothetical protein
MSIQRATVLLNCRMRIRGWQIRSAGIGVDTQQCMLKDAAVVAQLGEV